MKELQIGWFGLWALCSMNIQASIFYENWKSESLLQLAYLVDYMTFNGEKEHIWTRFESQISLIIELQLILDRDYGIKAFRLMIIHITVISFHSQSCQSSVLCRTPGFPCLFSSLSMLWVFYSIYCSLSLSLILVVYSKCIEAWSVYEITIASSG